MLVAGVWLCSSTVKQDYVVTCVNCFPTLCSLNECKTVLDSLKSRREVSYSRLSSLLVTKVCLFSSFEEFKSL